MSDRIQTEWSTLFRVLADERRRVLLEHLAQTEGPLSVAEAQALLVDDDAGPDDRTRVATKLYHVHLPKLDAAGVVEFDPDERRLTAGPALQSAVGILSHVDAAESDASRVHEAE